MIEQTDVPDLVRDTKTGALLNKNIGALQAYKKKKAAAAKLQELASSLEEKDKRLDKLESDITDIKEMLRQLIMK